jgi:hypothetical protein
VDGGGAVIEYILAWLAVISIIGLPLVGACLYIIDIVEIYREKKDDN